jgi:homoaconitase
MVQEMIDRDLGSLVDERRFRRTDERDEFGRRKWPEEKIPIGMESVRGFNVRAQIVGPQVFLVLLQFSITAWLMH